MEWVNVMSQFIANIGFPIFSAIAMMWLCYKQQQTLNDLNLTVSKNTEAIETLQDEIKNLKK